jgi:hypothetical protein
LGSSTRLSGSASLWYNSAESTPLAAATIWPRDGGSRSCSQVPSAVR